MKTNDLRAMSITQLNDELLNLLRSKFMLGMQISTHQLSNTSEIKKIRKSIAVVHTIITEKRCLNDR